MKLNNEGNAISNKSQICFALSPLDLENCQILSLYYGQTEGLKLGIQAVIRKAIGQLASIVHLDVDVKLYDEKKAKISQLENEKIKEQLKSTKVDAEIRRLERLSTQFQLKVIEGTTIENLSNK
jgi:hypothetical protein